MTIRIIKKSKNTFRSMMTLIIMVTMYEKLMIIRMKKKVLIRPIRITKMKHTFACSSQVPPYHYK
jgi:hypothetical protein